MRIDTVTYATASGWSAPLPTKLDGPATLVLVFGAPALGDDARAWKELRDAFPRAAMIGCSTAGEIVDTKVVDDRLVVAVVAFDHVTLRRAATSISTGSGSYDAGARLAHDLTAPDLRAVLVLSDGLDVNGTKLAEGLNAHLPKHVAVSGGLAADGERFQSTWVFDGEKCERERVVAVGLYGEHLVVRHGSKGGWDMFGPERRVTRSVGNVVYEVDGRPALDLYKQYLGDRAAGLPATALLFPLSIRMPGEDRKLVRTILGVDEATRSLTFAGDVPEGAHAQLMRANFDRLVAGAADAATSLVDEGSGPAFAIAVSCVGRRLVLGERVEEEVEAVRDALPAQTPIVGFYSYGELSPAGFARCDLHNQTMTLTVLGER